MLKSKFSERQAVDRRRKDHYGYHDFCMLYRRAKERLFWYQGSARTTLISG